MQILLITISTTLTIVWATLTALFIILYICEQNGRIKAEDERIDVEILYESEKSLSESYENKIEKLELKYYDLHNSAMKSVNEYIINEKVYKEDIRNLIAEKEAAEKVIEFLGKQNIILNNDLNNIEVRYSKDSKIIKDENFKRGYEKFLKSLQTSKEVI